MLSIRRVFFLLLLFSLKQAHNVQASWLLDVSLRGVLKSSSLAAMKVEEARQQSAFVAIRSLLSVRCLRAIEKKPFGVTVGAGANLEHLVVATEQCAAVGGLIQD